MRSIGFLLALGVLAAACGAGDTSSSSTSTTTSTTTSSTTPSQVRVVEPGDVAGLDDGTEVQVTAFLFIEEDMRLCEMMLESYPPQCGGGTVVVNGLEAADVVGLSSPADPAFAEVTWTDYPLTLRGVVRGGELDVTEIGHQVFTGEGGGIVTRVMPVATLNGVVFAMDATNTTTGSVVATFSDGQSGEVILRNASGTEVYRWSDGKAFDQAIRTIEIPAGGTFSALLNDELVLEGGWAIEAFLVADTLRQAVATGTIEVGG